MAVSQQGGSIGGQRRKTNKSGKGAETEKRVEELSASMHAIMEVMRADMKAAAERDELTKRLLLEEMRASADRGRRRADDRRRTDADREEQAALFKFLGSLPSSGVAPDPPHAAGNPHI